MSVKSAAEIGPPFATGDLTGTMPLLERFTNIATSRKGPVSPDRSGRELTMPVTG